MNNRKLFRGQLSLFTILSLGIIILGIGFSLWGMFSMWGHLLRYDTVSIITTETNKNTEDISLDKKIENDVGKLDFEVVSTVEKVLYPVHPVEGDHIGSLTIPALNLELPVFQGTGDKELKKGVGHFMQSVLPGEEDNSVLSGHRDTVFRRLGDLVIRDLLIIETSAGIFTYEISSTRIVDKSDKTVIVPTDHAVLTLTTCYPFRYVGPAPDRYIVSADLLINK